MAKLKRTERGWNSSLGVILAVAGSAVGFGNFLRFPGLAAQYGGGAFMIAYFTSLFLMGIPLSWMEWAIGRRGGALGAHSTAGMFMLLNRSRLWKYLGLMGVMAPLGICMYYLFLESWTLGYACKMVSGGLNFSSPSDFEQVFGQFVGLGENGAAFDVRSSPLLIFLVLAFLSNFWVMYRGVNRGIERFCKWSLPVLLFTSLLVLLRVLTLGTPDAAHPERSIDQGLGYMWNPDKTVLEVRDESGEWRVMEMLPGASAAAAEKMEREEAAAHGGDRVRTRTITLMQGLLNPSVWLAAAGQIFWSLSICFGAVATYASYVRNSADVALSSLTAASANECVEVGVAGMMIVPAAVAILGVSAVAGASTFGLGFHVLPQVFVQMPAGRLFGTLFFALLYLAAITSSISTIQPAIAFLEEFWLLTRSQSIVIAGSISLAGALATAWFSEGLMALDTLDFWMGTMSLYFVGGCFLTIFCIKWSFREAYEAVSSGAKIRVPLWTVFIIRWVAPLILFSIVISWVVQNLVERVSPPLRNLLDGKPGAWVPLLWCLLVFLFLSVVAGSSRRFHARLKGGRNRNSGS